MTKKLDALEAQQWRRLDKITRETERRIATAYKSAWDELNVKLSKLYASLGDPPTLQEARRYNRLARLQKKLSTEYRKLTGKVINGTEKNVARMFTEAAYSTQWAIDQATGIEIAFPVVRVDAIRSAVENPVTGLSPRTILQTNTANRINRINAVLTRSLAGEASYAETARLIKKEFQGGYADAIRVVRTESNRAMSEGHLYTTEAAEEAGVKLRRRWVATLDDRTRDTHGILDGQYEDEDGLFHVHGASAPAPGMFGVASEDINCRCTTVDEIEGLEPELRRIRDEGVVEYKTFAQWAEPKGWTPERGWPKAEA